MQWLLTAAVRNHYDIPMQNKTRMRTLHTADQIIRALGGLDAVVEMTGTNKKQAWNWSGRAKVFPSAYYVMMQRELQRRGYKADPSLWSQKTAKRAA